MITRKRLTGLVLATAAAGMFAAATVSSAAEQAKVECDGANACKGKSSCQTANNACKGQNSCKGKGKAEVSKADCDALHAKAKAGAAKK